MNFEEQPLKKTSAEWYVEFTDGDIIDPDGWRLETNPSEFWYCNQITKDAFLRRAYSSTMLPYGEIKHSPPFYRQDCIIIDNSKTQSGLFITAWNWMRSFWP